MTATKQPDGFWTTLWAHTSAVWWATYDKLITGILAAVAGWGLVVGTAYVGKLPQPELQKPAIVAVTPPTDVSPARLDSLEKLIKDQSTAVDALVQELRKRQKPVTPPQK